MPNIKQQTIQDRKQLFTDVDRQTQEVLTTVNELNIKSFKSSFNNVKNFFNTALFSLGYHKGFSLKVKDFISAVPGAVIDADVSVFTTQNIVSNLSFNGSVSIADTACITFDKCIFKQTTFVEAGGKANFIGCIFEQPITNAGISADVNVIGCQRSSSVAHTNVTVIAELTF